MNNEMNNIIRDIDLDDVIMNNIISNDLVNNPIMQTFPIDLGQITTVENQPAKVEHLLKKY